MKNKFKFLTVLLGVILFSFSFVKMDNIIHDVVNDKVYDIPGENKILYKCWDSHCKAIPITKVEK